MDNWISKYTRYLQTGLCFEAFERYSKLHKTKVIHPMLRGYQLVSSNGYAPVNYVTHLNINIAECNLFKLYDSFSHL
jgi:hypothetical protein